MRRVFLLLLLVLAGCASDDSDTGTPLQSFQHVPVIGTVALSPDTALYMEGDGGVSVTARFDYADLGSDIESVHIETSDGTTFDVNFAEASTEVIGTYTEQFELSTAASGPRTVDIWLVDTQGAVSNHSTAEFYIISSDSAATDIVFSDVVLDQFFQSSLLRYTAAVSVLIPTTTLTVSLSDVNATIAVNGAAVEADVASDKITLDQGANTIDVEITAEDGVTTTTYIFEVTRRTVESLAQRAYIKASNTDQWGNCGSVDNPLDLMPSVWDTLNPREGTWDKFGASVALDGNTLVVGADWEDSARTGINGDLSFITDPTYVGQWGVDCCTTSAGAVYVFARDASGVWSQQAYIKASNTDAGDQFGSSVALDGDTLAVGAWGEDSGAIGIGGDQGDNSADRSGAVYVFTRDSDGVWSQQAYIKASNTDAKDYFGSSVALDGDTLAVGAWGEDSSATGINGDQGDNSADGSGAVYQFTRDAKSVWSQQAYIKASNREAGDQFGSSVALDGDRLAVGSVGEGSSATGIDGDQGDNSAGRSGAVYVFTRDPNSVWNQQAYIKASNTDAGDQFGSSVALDGDTLAVGAWGEDSSATGINGDQGDNSADGSGAVYQFTRDAKSVWSQQAYIKASNTNWYDLFGSSVALDGDTLAVGAEREDSGATGIGGDQGDDSALGAGALYLFTRDASGAWSQQVYIKASNTDGRDRYDSWGDLFGSSVALDGDRLAVGAVGEGSSAAGIDGDQSDNSHCGAGAVYIFQ